MNYTLRARKLVGSPHVRHSIVVDGVEIHAQISPYSPAEAAERVHLHKHPPKPGITAAERWGEGPYSQKGRKKTTHDNNFEDEAA